MTRELVLWPDSCTAAVMYAQVREQGREAAGDVPGMVAPGALDEAHRRLRCVVVLPGTEVLLARARVPGGRRAQIRAAAPYALEEQLAEPVEHYHFAVGPREATGSCDVACVARARLERLVQTLAAAGVQPASLVPEMLILPWTPGEWSVLALAGRWVVRTGRGSGFAAEPALAGVLLGAALDDADAEAPSTIRIHGEGPEGEVRAAVARAVAGRVAVRAEGPAGGDPRAWLLAGDTPLAHPLDLGGAMREQAGGGRVTPGRRYRVAAALLCVWLVVEVGAKALAWRELAAEHAALEARIEALYRETFPEARHVDDPRRQMAAHLRRLTGGQGQGPGFLAMTSAAARHLEGIEGFELLSVDYRDGRLDLELRLPDLNALDRFKNALEASTPLRAEILSASNREGYVRGRLRVAAAGNAS